MSNRLEPITVPDTIGKFRKFLLWIFAVGVIAVFVNLFDGCGILLPVYLQAHYLIFSLLLGVMIATPIRSWFNRDRDRRIYEAIHENMERAAVNNDSTTTEKLKLIFIHRKGSHDFEFAIMSHPSWRVTAK